MHRPVFVLFSVRRFETFKQDITVCFAEPPTTPSYRPTRALRHMPPAPFPAQSVQSGAGCSNAMFGSLPNPQGLFTSKFLQFTSDVLRHIYGCSLSSDLELSTKYKLGEANVVQRYRNRDGAENLGREPMACNAMLLLR
jgi:hypothetical protein